MRKLLFAVVVLLAVITLKAPVGHAANDSISLFLSDKQLKPEVSPKIINDTTMVPVRIISEELGAKVSWNQSEKKVTVEKPGLAIQLVVGKKEANVNGSVQSLETAPVIVEGNTLLPVRFISERMGLKVLWDELTRSVSLYPTDGTEASALSEIQKVTVSDGALHIQASGEVKGNFTYLSNPDRLVVDVPNSSISQTINGSGTTQKGEIAIEDPSISKVRYALYSSNPSIVRIVVDLKQKIEYNVIGSNLSNEIAVSIKVPKYRVVLDAGHGDHDSGAVSVNGRYEKDFNLAVILKVAKLLENEPKIETRLTRSDDTFVELNDRVAFANNWSANVFVSVHANKSNSPSAHGSETYYFNDYSANLANILHGKILQATGFYDRRVRTADFRVIKYTNMPAVLCEIGYLSNSDDEQALFDENMQNKVAEAIAAGIKQYLQIS